MVAALQLQLLVVMSNFKFLLHWLWRVSFVGLFISSLVRYAFSSTVKSKGRVVSRLVTSQRRVSQARVVARASRSSLQNLCPSEPVHGNLEMDSHADTCVLGKNCIQLHSTGRECDVFPYTDDYDGITDVPIVSGATAWTDQETGETFILVIHESLWMPDQVEHTLLNPNQLRSFGSTVQDNPFAGTMYIESPGGDVKIPMSLEGSNVALKTRTPTQDELDNCSHIELTSQHLWDPSNLKVPIKVSSIERASEGLQSGYESDEGEVYNPIHFTKRMLKAVEVRGVPRN